MRFVFFTLMLLSVMLFSKTGECMASDWNKAPDCVLEAASQGLAGYLEKISPEEAASYGFSSAEALAETMARPSFGSPLLLRTIAPAALESYTEGMTLTDLISDMELWFVPVLERQRVAAFLVVEQSAKFPCQAVSFGYTHLATDYEATLGRVGVQRRDKAVLVVVQQAREHFIAFPDDEPGRLYSLRAQMPRNDQGAGEDESSLSSVIKRLKPVVKANLQQTEEL